MRARGAAARPLLKARLKTGPERVSQSSGARAGMAVGAQRVSLGAQSARGDSRAFLLASNQKGKEMPTTEQLRTRQVALLRQAAALADVAGAEGRELTATESAMAEKCLADADALKGKIAKAAGDDALRQQIETLGKGLERGYTADGRAGGAWGKAALAAMGRAFGGKQLLTPSGSVGVPSLSQTIPAAGERLETILQVIPTVPLSTSSVEYLREVVRVHAADVVAEGGVKPTSTYELEEIDAPARVIAHLSASAPRTWFADAPSLQRYLDTVMRQGVQLALEDQVINGTGAAPDLEGLLAVGHQYQAFDTDLLATCRKAITLMELASVDMNGLCYAFYPTDWEAMELLETASLGYKMNAGSGARAPINRQLRTLWGAQVALSLAVPEGTGLLFDRRAVELHEREGITLSWSENMVAEVDGVVKSDFERNLIRWRAEGRWAFCTFRPAAIVEIDLGAGS